MGKAGTSLVDGRSAPAFDGTGPMIGVFRAGHIPGAVNVPYTTVLDAANRYLPVDSLRAKFDAAGVKPGDDVVAYCGSGRTATPDLCRGEDARVHSSSLRRVVRGMVQAGGSAGRSQKEIEPIRVTAPDTPSWA